MKVTLLKEILNVLKGFAIKPLADPYFQIHNNTIQAWGSRLYGQVIIDENTGLDTSLPIDSTLKLLRTIKGDVELVNTGFKNNGISYFLPTKPLPTTSPEPFDVIHNRVIQTSWSSLLYPLPSADSKFYYITLGTAEAMATDGHRMVIKPITEGASLVISVPLLECFVKMRTHSTLFGWNSNHTIIRTNTNSGLWCLIDNFKQFTPAPYKKRIEQFQKSEKWSFQISKKGVELLQALLRKTPRISLNCESGELFVVSEYFNEKIEATVQEPVGQPVNVHSKYLLEALEGGSVVQIPFDKNLPIAIGDHYFMRDNDGK